MFLLVKRKELEHTLDSMKSSESTHRLQKVLDEKKKKQAREAEKLRQEVPSISEILLTL